MAEVKESLLKWRILWMAKIPKIALGVGGKLLRLEMKPGSFLSWKLGTVSLGSLVGLVAP